MGEGRERVWFAHAVRGPACLLVVFAHLFDAFLTDQAAVARTGHFAPVNGLPHVPWQGAVASLAGLGITPGAVGVLLFFLVSGFVIPFSLTGEKRRGFLVRRFFRLYPTLWVCLGVTLTTLAVQALVQAGPLPYGAKEAGTGALLVGQYTWTPFIEPVLWSLAVEELFYLVAATVAWRNVLSSVAAVVGAAAGLAAVSVATGGTEAGGPLFWLGFNAGFACFVLLGVVAHHLYRRTWGPGQSFLAASSILGLYLVAVHHGPAAAVAFIYRPSSLLALAVFSALFLARARLPYSAVLDRLSDISYPLYLLHGVNGYVLLRAVYVLTGNYYAAAGAALAASILVATAVHHWVEVPTNELGRRLSRWRWRRRPALGPAPGPEPLPAQAVP